MSAFNSCSCGLGRDCTCNVTQSSGTKPNSNYYSLKPQSKNFSDALKQRSNRYPELMYRVKHENVEVPLYTAIIEFDMPKARLRKTLSGQSMFRCSNPLCNTLHPPRAIHLTLDGYNSKPMAKWCLACGKLPNFISLVISHLPRYKNSVPKHRIAKIKRIHDGEQKSGHSTPTHTR